MVVCHRRSALPAADAMVLDTGPEGGGDRTASPATRQASARPGSAHSARLPAGALRPQSAKALVAGKAVLPAELGLAGRRVLTLPSHVGDCSEGNNCCWRWLAHSLLKETSWLREDLDQTRKLQEKAQSTIDKVHHDTEAFAELRGVHNTSLEQLTHYRTEVCELRHDLNQLKIAHALKLEHEERLSKANEMLKQDNARLQEKLRNESSRANEAVQGFAIAEAKLQKLQEKALTLQDAATLAQGQLKTALQERDLLRQQLEDFTAAKAKGKAKAKAKASARRR